MKLVVFSAFATRWRACARHSGQQALMPCARARARLACMNDMFCVVRVCSGERAYAPPRCDARGAVFSTPCIAIALSTRAVACHAAGRSQLARTFARRALLGARAQLQPLAGLALAHAAGAAGCAARRAARIAAADAAAPRCAARAAAAASRKGLRRRRSQATQARARERICAAAEARKCRRLHFVASAAHFVQLGAFSTCFKTRQACVEDKERARGRERDRGRSCVGHFINWLVAVCISACVAPRAE
eukprot:6204275-Pleurochrysis_carterae.AAC.3